MEYFAIRGNDISDCIRLIVGCQSKLRFCDWEFLIVDVFCRLLLSGDMSHEVTCRKPTTVALMASQIGMGHFTQENMMNDTA